MWTPARILFLPALFFATAASLGTVGVAQQRSALEAPAPNPGLEGIRRLTLDQGPVGTLVPIALPDGRTAPVHLTRFERTPGGGTTSYGPFDSDPLGYAAFAARGDALEGVIHFQGVLYRAHGTSMGTVALEKIAPESFRPCDLAFDDPGTPAPAEADPTQESTGTQNSTVPNAPRGISPGPLRPTFSRAKPSGIGDTVVDVLVIWTTEARVAAGGTEAMLAKIDLAVLETNVAYDSSEVDLFMRLVFTGETPYTESGSMATDLARLRAEGDGFIDLVHALRNTYGADAVSMIVKDNTRCGRSYNMGTTPPASFAGSAFNLVAQDCATGEYAFAHEFGHNFGLDHDRPNTQNIPSYPFAYGYWLTDDVHRTIMALERQGNPGTRIQFYSNPNVTFLGEPLGIPDPEPQSADCAQALNLNAPFVAAWRSTIVP